MSAERLLQSLQKLLVLHQNLLNLTKNKTEILKSGDMEALNLQMNEENKYILAIKQIENDRIKQVQQILQNYRLREEEQTLSKCIDFTVEPVKSKLRSTQLELTRVIDELKKENELNQQLIQQSLQFVNASIGMLRPETQTTNYKHPEKKQSTDTGNRSMFDSKA
ncbi:flagellar protein FlgN [Cytobacillus suaedae]|nr:flagellar protein FlgN [Cytobacillus suaedae]